MLGDKSMTEDLIEIREYCLSRETSGNWDVQRACGEKAPGNAR